MSRETKVAQIPDVRNDNVTEVLRAIKNVIEVREGHLGDELDQNVTLRDLKDIGVVQGGGFSVLTSGAKVPVLITGTSTDGYDPETDYTTPPAPAGLTASSGFSNVYLAWPGAPYRNHAYTEIWRASVDNLGDAVRIGTTATNVYADAAEEGATYYYWIRFVSVANVTGPYNDTEGTPVTTAIDPGPVLDLLSGQITESELYSTLSDRIDLIDAAPSVTNSVAWRVAQEAAARATAIQAEASTRAQAILGEASSRTQAVTAEATARASAISAEAQARAQGLLDEAAARQAAISQEATTRQAGDASLASQISTLSASVTGQNNTLTAAIQSEASARATAVSAEATARDTLATQLRGTYTGNDLTQVTTGLIFSERSSRITADSALQTQINTLVAASSGDFGELFSAITDEQTARIAGDQANASSVSTISSRLDNVKDASGNATNKSIEATLVDDRQARVNGDSALSSAVSSLSSTVTSNYSTLNSAITNEQQTRATAISSEASQRDTLATQIRGTYTGSDLSQVTSGLIFSERSSRVTADAALQTQINTLSAASSGDFQQLLAAVQSEQTARIDADTAEATSRESLATQIRGSYQGTDPSALAAGILYNERQTRISAESAISSQVSALSSTVTSNYNTLNSAITSEATTRASGDSALSSQISALSSTVSGNLSSVNAAISSEAITRASADTAISTSVTNLSSSVDALQNIATGFDTGLSWNFDSTVEGWSASGGTLSWSNGSIRLNASTNDPILGSPAFSLAGSNNYIIRARVMRLAGSSWQGDVYYTTASHGATESYKKTIANTTALNAWRVVEWDMSALTAGGSDWTSSTITSIRIDLGGSSADQFLVDWVAIGRVAPTSYSAAIQQEATTRATQDSSLATQITTLSSTVTGNYNTLNAAIQTEQTARANADTAFSSSISTLQASVNSNTVAIQNEQSVRAAADNGLYAQYTVKIDNNGHVSGFGLASTSSNAGPTSAFIVRADRFAIAGPNDTTDPLGTLSPTKLPFIVTTTSTTVNGKTYPAGTWVDTAFIANATITNAQIETLTADKITTGSLTAAVGITTGRISGGVNTTFSPGSANFGTGFYLGLDSSAFKFYVGSFAKNMLWDGTNLSIKGTISASNATFQGLTITDNSGNVLLSSGGIPSSVVSGLGALATQSSVSVGQVSGLGSLATQNSVFIGSNVQIYNGSSWVTLNSGDFVNYLSKITSSNIVNFMGPSAITDAYIGNLNASKITAGTIAADRLDASVINAKVTNIDAAVIGSGTIANARIGDLSAKKIYCGTSTNAVDFVDPGQTSIPLNSTASGWFSYTGDTGASTYVPATCDDGFGGSYDCSYFTYGAAPVTSAQVQFVCGDSSVPRARRVRSGVVRFHLIGSATVDHYFSLWARGGTVANPGAWFPLVVSIEPQSNYGATSASCFFDVNMVYGQMIQFAMHATDLNGNYWNGNQGRELRYSNLTVFGVNF